MLDWLDNEGNPERRHERENHTRPRASIGRAELDAALNGDQRISRVLVLPFKSVIV